MIQYIYFVKCPNCEDEAFDLFDEAKAYATGCLSKQPIITQVEVCRNDFGECTNSTDLGVKWSWEDCMSDIPEDPELFILDKTDTLSYDPNNDSEFNSLDNTLDSVPDNFKKPGIKLDEWTVISNNNTNISNNNTNNVNNTNTAANNTVTSPQTLRDLAVTVKMPNVNVTWRIYVSEKSASGGSCEAVDIKVPYSREKMAYANSFSFGKLFTNATSAVRREVFNNTGVYPSVIRIWVYNDDNNIILVNTHGCHFIIDKNDFISQIKNQLSLYASGAPSLQSGKPIPEGMTIEQLVEEMEENEDMVECTRCNDLFDKSECRYEVNLGWLCSRCVAAMKSEGETLTFRENNYWDFLDECAFTEEPNSKTLKESRNEEQVEFDYEGLDVTLTGGYDNGGWTSSGDIEFPSWDEEELKVDFTYSVDRTTVEEAIIDLMSDDKIVETLPEDLRRVFDGEDTSKSWQEENALWDKYFAEHFNRLVEKYNDLLKEYFEDSAREYFEETYSLDNIDDEFGGYYTSTKRYRNGY